MKTKINLIPGKMESFHVPEVNAILDKWINYDVTLQEFDDAVLHKGLTIAREKKSRAWIVDSSDAKGVFSKAIQEFIGTDVFSNFAKNGIKYFITVLPKDPITKLTVKNYSSKAGPNGVTLVEVGTEEDAIAFLEKNH